MVIEVKPVEENVDAKAIRVFLKTIELLGGPRKLIEYRNLTWLPSLMTASYAIVYAKDKGYTAETIANILGISTTTARNILRADEEAVKARLEMLANEKAESLGEEKRTHIAGGLAKLAYKEIQQGRDEINLALALGQEVSKSLGVDWAVKVLSMLKGTDFPIEKEHLISKLKGIKIKGKPIEEIAEKLNYPIATPAQLLHEIAQAIKEE
ncbi:MAG: hypothetical protein GXN99_01985 [Candidatus Nanohaloarchaeota archaeon]|nr:hypothetical protein [Candidatus Nanohaloarchaeota archaeon]